jgi:signal transduction histidine kinase
MTIQDSERASDPQLEMLRKQLAQAQKMAALGELVSTTTHEFNNVLMTIINYAKMGLRHKDVATRDKALQKILDAGQRASKITNSVLGMARNRSQQFEPTNLTAVVEQSLLLLEREMRKYRISIERKFEAVPDVLACGNQIQQVLLNLLINARQAMDRGGTVRITLKADPEAGTVDLTVRDSGCGMDSERLRKIFDPYFSTKQGPDESGRGGTGLGLAISRNIIEGFGGTIGVQSRPGEGSTFSFALPLAPVVGEPTACTGGATPKVPQIHKTSSSRLYPPFTRPSADFLSWSSIGDGGPLTPCVAAADSLRPLQRRQSPRCRFATETKPATKRRTR